MGLKEKIKYISMKGRKMNKALKEILFSEEEIRAKVKELGKEITHDYMDKDLYVVGILKGSFIFMADLVREISLPLLVDFMSVSSYGRNAKSNGEVKILKDLDFSVEGRDILIVEDIIDSGFTLKYIEQMFKTRGANSVKFAAFLDKKESRKVEMEVHYKGYEVPNDFIVGYGLDYSEEYRNLPYIATLKEEVYK